MKINKVFFVFGIMLCSNLLISCDDESEPSKTTLKQEIQEKVNQRIQEKTDTEYQSQNKPNLNEITNYGNNTFLWKPMSENDGNLVVLTPAKYPKATLTANGMSGAYSGRSNGNRCTYRFSKTGASFGAKIEVVLSRNGEILKYWIVPSGAQRNEQ